MEHLSDIVVVLIMILVILLIAWSFYGVFKYCEGLNWTAPECSNVNVTIR